MLDSLHSTLVFDRRVRVLADAIVERLPQGARVLDIGCGSGDLAARIMQLRPDVRIEGIDVLVRPGTAIPVTAFDGYHAPFTDAAFDAAILVDVLHHADEPERLLAEAARIARIVIVKDHLRDGFAAYSTLRFMDWIGNAAHGVRLPYNYMSLAEWKQAWANLGLTSSRFATTLALYPRPFSWLFGRGLHFVGTLSR